MLCFVSLVLKLTVTQPSSGYKTSENTTTMWKDDNCWTPSVSLCLHQQFVILLSSWESRQQSCSHAALRFGKQRVKHTTAPRVSSSAILRRSCCSWGCTFPAHWPLKVSSTFRSDRPGRLVILRRHTLMDMVALLPPATLFTWRLAPSPASSSSSNGTCVC